MTSPELKPEKPWTQEIYRESLKLYIRARLKNELCAEFEVKPLQLYDDGKGKPWKFEKRSGTVIVPTDNPDEGELLVRVEVKWDGCSHVYFQPYIHGCDRKDLTRFGALFEEIFDMAMAMMPGNNEYLA